jgi:hypothetical protein
MERPEKRNEMCDINSVKQGGFGKQDAHVLSSELDGGWVVNGKAQSMTNQQGEFK